MKQFVDCTKADVNINNLLSRAKCGWHAFVDRGFGLHLPCSYVGDHMCQECESPDFEEGEGDPGEEERQEEGQGQGGEEAEKGSQVRAPILEQAPKDALSFFVSAGFRACVSPAM